MDSRIVLYDVESEVCSAKSNVYGSAMSRERAEDDSVVSEDFGCDDEVVEMLREEVKAGGLLESWSVIFSVIKVISCSSVLIIALRFVKLSSILPCASSMSVCILLCFIRTSVILSSSFFISIEDFTFDAFRAVESCMHCVSRDFNSPLNVWREVLCISKYK